MEMFREVEGKLAVAKEEALSAVVSEFFAAINRQGFTAAEFLEAVADVVHEVAGYKVAFLMEKVIASVAQAAAVGVQLKEGCDEDGENDDH